MNRISYIIFISKLDFYINLFGCPITQDDDRYSLKRNVVLNKKLFKFFDDIVSEERVFGKSVLGCSKTWVMFHCV